MKKKLNLLIVLLLTLGIYSCQQDEVSEDPSPSQKESTLKFVYNDVVHSIGYSTSDTTIVYDKDSDSYLLLNKLLENPELAILIHSKDSIEYFDNSILMEQELEKRYSS